MLTTEISSLRVAGLTLEELSGYVVEFRYDPESWPG